MWKYRWHNSGESFLASLRVMPEDALLNQSLTVGLARRLLAQNSTQDDAPLLFTVEGEEGVAATALMTPPRKLILYAEPDAAPDLAREIHARDWNIPGVLANDDAAVAFVQTWSELTGLSYRLRKNIGLYFLQKVESVTHSPGSMRKATFEDIELLLAWQRNFQCIALPDEPLDDAVISKMVVESVEAGERYIWEDGTPVAMASANRPTYTGTCVSAVYTPPELRNRGYATSLVTQLSQMILDSGKSHGYLFTDLANPTSNAIYRKIGYVPVCDFSSFVFDALEE